VHGAGLLENGVLHLDDLINFTSNELQEMTGMNHGTAAHVLAWAKADKDSLDQDCKLKRGCQI
jgi:hypothetical protein